MKYLLLIIALVISPVATFASDIASVNFNAIKEDLRNYYFSKPENSKIKEEFQAAILAEKNYQDDIQKKLMDGKKPIDLRSTIPKALSGVERYQLEKKIDGDLKKELYLIVSGLGLKYELIYDASNSETIIYAKSQVDDVTTTVKQAIIELGKKNGG